MSNDMGIYNWLEIFSIGGIGQKGGINKDISGANKDSHNNNANNNSKIQSNTSMPLSNNNK